MTTLRIRQEAAGEKKHRIRLPVKRPGVTNIEAETTITITSNRRTLLP
jgi:hypothetical protein